MSASTLIQQNADKGSVIIDDMSLTNFDGSRSVSILGFVSALSLTEDIFENVIKGTFIFLDGIGLMTYLPIVGEEVLTIAFRTAQDFTPYKKSFRVYKIEDVQQAKDNTSGITYILHVVSQEFIQGESLRVNRSYKNMTVSDVVKDVYTNFLAVVPAKTIKIDPTINVQNINISSKTPLQALNLLTTFGQSKDSVGSMFLFYENRTGFNYIHTETLFQQTPSYTFHVQQENSPYSGNAKYPNTPLPHQIPDAVVHSRSFDHLSALSSGMFSNQVDAVDLLVKRRSTNTYNYQDQFHDTKHVESGAALPVVSSDFNGNSSQCYKLVNSRTMRSASNYFTNNDPDQLTYSKTYEAYLPYRLSMYQQMMFTEVSMVVAGNTNIQAGDVVVVYLEARSPTKNASDEKYNKYLQGRFLVKSITHIITGKKFKSQLSLSKDCYVGPIKTDLPNNVS